MIGQFLAWMFLVWLAPATLVPTVSVQTDLPPADETQADTTRTTDASGPVYVVPVDGMIDRGLAMYIERAVSDAESDNASAIIFHVDTFGGLVDAADVIRKTILKTPILTVAYIDPNAASAGALISYAADSIAMAPGGSIGAATVVEGVGGEAAPDKYQSYMRGLMRATAEANGRDPRIAEAMVDQDLEVEGISKAGQVLTLSTNEAVKLGVADRQADSIGDVISWLGLTDRPVVNHSTSAAERIIRFFGSPVLQSILMLMMLGGLYFELQTPGVGFPGLMAVAGAFLFFGPNYLLGLVESWEMMLFLIGVVLLMLEIFVIPGFGIAGISGLILVVLSLGMALIGNVGFSIPAGESINTAVWTLAITLVLFVGLGIFIGRFLPRSERLGRLILSPELTSAAGFTTAETRNDLVGQHGSAITPLRPAGTAKFGDERVDVITAGGFIEAGSGIEVVSVRGARVEVRAIAQLAEGTRPENETST